VFFHPDSITVDSVHFPLVLTSFYLYNEKIESGPNPFFDGPIEDVREITLAHNQNYIGFEFSVLDYRSASKISYAYILENYDQNWNFSGSQNRAFYKNLKPGKYIFKVKSTNYSGIWNETPRTIRITVRKPFWQSDRAMVLYFFLLFGLSGLTYYLAAKRIRQKIDLATEKRLNLKKMWFYAAVSHEFKSPLTLLLGMVDRLIANTRQNNEVQSRLKIIKQNALRLLHLLEEMGDYRKVQNGILKENRQNTELVGFFYEFYEAFREYAEMRNVSFEFTTNLSHFKAEIDREHMERIILNLLTSVFKFSTPDRGVRLSLNIEPEKQAFFVVIRFVLNDIEKESIFAEPKDSYVEPGVFDSGNPGISMALCKELISLLNGKVEMTSNKNHEINFTVEFPLFPSMGKESLPVLKWLPDTTTWMKGELTDGVNKAKGQSARIYGTVLVVDDHDAFRLFMAESLKNKYQVWEAAEGFSALELARKQLPDLILCDLEMPGMNGIDLIGKLKSSHLTSHIPVVVLSAYSSDEHKMESLGVGADGFITKPFNMEFLIGTIDNIIRQRKILREHYNFQTNAHQEKKPASDPNRSFIQKTIECIEAHLSDQNFSVDELAEILGYSRSVFYQKVKAAAGKTPNDLIKSIRMKKAAEMLRTSNKSISQVASEVGFSDMAYFRKCFRDVYGENPSAYHGKYE
jgi:CheY-like chemotaxis protein/signal transduction histidine kinase/AraC-like DNA-binding protein